MKSTVRNELLVCALALFFAWAFFFLKHDPLLRDIIPFGEDPYDAVGSFAFIATGLLAAISLARVLVAHATRRSGSGIYVVRTQAAVPLCIVMTVSADAIAMLRHISQWHHTPGEAALLVILGCLAAASVSVLIMVAHPSGPQTFSRWATPFIIFFTALVCIWLYPESLIRHIATHLITVDVADVLLVVPVASFVLALFPDNTAARTHTPNPSRAFGLALRWTVVGILGLAIGLAAFAAEMRDSPGSVSLAKLALVGAVYGWLGLSGLLIAYAFLRKPLGLQVARPSHARAIAAQEVSRDPGSK